jgi:sugar phosphate isomerase/epimerase
MHEGPGYSRRVFIKSAALTATGLALGWPGLSKNLAAGSMEVPKGKATASPICVFSKHLQWLSLPDMIKTTSDLGFDGVDLTVRKGGHIEPEKAETELPSVVNKIRKAGLEVPMIVTNITDAKDPLSEAIIKTAGQLGIKHYRTGYLKYNPALGVAKSLDVFKKQLTELAALNKKHNIQGAYQNHSGVQVGAAVWDLWYLLKDIDPQWLGVQYDIKHATLEGGNSWVHDLDLLRHHIRCLDIKDFIWEKTNGKWQAKYVPLGDGMVDYPQFLKLLKTYNITGPMSIHFEYDLGGADEGKKEISIPRDQVLAAMKRDLLKLKQLRQEANFG